MKKSIEILKKNKDGVRLTNDEALHLLGNADLIDLAEAANQKRKTLHKDNVVSFVIDRNINYTNICKSKCLFCAFYKEKNENGGYLISKEELSSKIEECMKIGGRQILLQGGLNKDLDINYYIDLLSFIKNKFKIHIHGFSPPEIHFISEQSNLSIRKTLEILIEAGLDSIPGGGAEILVDEIRSKISPNKCNSQTWLKIMEEAHNLRLKSSATMMFGHIEEAEDIILHLFKLRELQDKTKGFTAFIPWTFQSQNTKIQKFNKKSSLDYLRVLAVCRLYLDNFKNIQASWVTQKDKIAQMALFFGANDFGSTMIEENVVAAAGVKFRLSKEDIIYLIESAGFKAKTRNYLYEFVE